MIRMMMKRISTIIVRPKICDSNLWGDILALFISGGGVWCVRGTGTIIIMSG